MTDPFSTLHHPDERAEPRPQFRDELLAEVRRRMADDIGASRPSSPNAPTTTLISVKDTPMDTDRQNRRRILMAAAAVIVVAGGLTAIAVARSAANEPAPAAPRPVATSPSPAPAATTTTVSATTAAPTTTAATATVPARSTSGVGDAMLLVQEEWAPGWQQFGTEDGRRRLQPDIARTIPACADYMAPVFEAAAAAEVLNRTFHHPFPTEAAFGQFVVVLPDEAAAIDMFAALTSPGLAACAAEYAKTGPMPEGFGQPTSPAPFDPVGDQMAFSDYQTTWIHPLTGKVHGPEEDYGAIVRVGRTITMTGALHMGDDDGIETTTHLVEVVSADQFHQLLVTVVTKATAALA